MPVRLLKSSARIFTRPSLSHPTSSQSQMWCSADSQFRWRTQYLLEHAVPSSIRASRSREAQLAIDKNKNIDQRDRSSLLEESSQVKSSQVMCPQTNHSLQRAFLEVRFRPICVINSPNLRWRCGRRARARARDIRALPARSALSLHAHACCEPHGPQRLAR